MGTTVKLKRIGSETIDTISIELFIHATRRANIIDKTIIINDIGYDYSSTEIQASGGSAAGGGTQIIKAGSITASDLNAGAGTTTVEKLFANAKPAGKRIVNFYNTIKTPFAGGPAIAFFQLLPANVFYNAANPVPNTAGFAQTPSLVGGAMAPINSSEQAGVKGQVNIVSAIPSGNPYTAGEVEFYIEVLGIPAFS
ncbi:MAG: hypothetical protein WAQ28_13590 [Bacteroidia bacterium]|jgi:hypothetical protein